MARGRRRVRRRGWHRFTGLLAAAIALAVLALPLSYLAHGGAGAAEVLAALYQSRVPELTAEPPRSPADAEIGVEYPFVLEGCYPIGHTPIDFDGSYWDADADEERGFRRLEKAHVTSLNGTIRLIDPGTAVFTGPRGTELVLTRHRGPWLPRASMCRVGLF